MSRMDDEDEDDGADSDRHFRRTPKLATSTHWPGPLPGHFPGSEYRTTVDLGLGERGPAIHVRRNEFRRGPLGWPSMDEDFAARAQVLRGSCRYQRPDHSLCRGGEQTTTSARSLPASRTTRTASFAGVLVPGRGGAAIVAFLASLPGGSAGTAPPMKTSHLFTNLVIHLDGDQAEARSRAAVYSVRGTPEQVRVRGISYQDLVRRTPDGWRIANRVHSVAWEGGMEKRSHYRDARSLEEQ